jgi:uncharacterized protein
MVPDELFRPYDGAELRVHRPVERFPTGSSRVFPDPEHSEAEERFKAIGRTDDGRGVLIVFTLRRQEGDTFIRPVSARYMHGKEVEYYEKEIAKAEKR